MSLTVETQPPSLRIDPDGVARIGGTQVTLDTIVTAFREVATAKEIAQDYPSLDLADIYAVIGYVLRHTRQVDAYLARRQEHAEEIRRKLSHAKVRAESATA